MILGAGADLKRINDKTAKTAHVTKGGQLLPTKFVLFSVQSKYPAEMAEITTQTEIELHFFNRSVEINLTIL